MIITDPKPPGLIFVFSKLEEKEKLIKDVSYTSPGTSSSVKRGHKTIPGEPVK